MARLLRTETTRSAGKGTMAGEPYRTRFREKGKMAARSTDVYLPKEGMKDAGVCTGCHAIYHNKRWYPGEDASTKTGTNEGRYEVTCPACLRMQDNNPAGVVTFGGDYLVEHEEIILNTIKNVEEKVRAKNPLARIMRISQEGNELIIRTTDEKLAEKLGRDIYRAHSGKLEYQWSKKESFVRVNWSR